MRSFVIVVDAQGDFVRADGALSVAGADALVGPMNAWLAALTPEETAGVLFTFDTHEEEIYRGSKEAEQFRLHCVRGTAGWNTVLDPGAIDARIPLYRLEKGVFDMWEEADVCIEPMRGGAATPRDRFFETLKTEGVTHVTVIGVAADYCVRWAIQGLVDRGFAVTVPGELTRGIARQMPQVLGEDFAGKPVALA
ncbi:Nicotinamidase-related amidase [Sphingomonas jatrophae]|uniref:nicotinamidase n=2 Tax=Sphingomonas jatrophae TaxID=1166337 RepID=A0A1I6K2K9_9SPHN|nr:isochorismatase family protein [Sphingomonas jatrophae]SFR85426.1 Nicotinamidase-related amidase [Sphingomonas jatrophae]